MRLILSDFQRLKNLCASKRAYWLVVFDYSTLLLLHYRFFGFLRRKIKFPVTTPFERISEFILKAQFSPLASVDSGLMIIHGYGIVVHGKVVAGKNLTLYHRVTLGIRFPGDDAPVVGDNVVIGTGACVLGPVNIPSNTIIPANACITPGKTDACITLKRPEIYGIVL